MRQTDVTAYAKAPDIASHIQASLAVIVREGGRSSKRRRHDSHECHGILDAPPSRGMTALMECAWRYPPYFAGSNTET